MAGDVIGVTDLTGLRVGSNSPGVIGSACTWMSFSQSSISALNVLGNQISVSTVPFSNVTPGDIITATLTSALSNAVALGNVYVSSPGVVSLSFSNASSTSQVIAAQTVSLAAFRMSNATRF